MERYYNENDECGVLISPGYGAGWGTWNSTEIALDKRIIEKFLDGISSDKMCDYIEELGYERPYMGGYSSLVLEFVTKGSRFKIDEYDGHESLSIEYDDDFMTA